MKRTIGITLLEFVKLVKKREFLIGLGLVLVMGGGMVYGAYSFPDSFGVHNVIALPRQKLWAWLLPVCWLACAAGF